MSHSCEENQRVGALGKYCPLLMTQNKMAPFCLGENGIGPSCYAWEMAEKVSQKNLHFPEITLDNAAAADFYFIDYLLAGKKILCVEDNKVSMKVLTKSLGKLKPLIVEAENGQAALDVLVASNEIGLVLLDLEMPVMSGVEMMDKILDFYGEELPFTVILVSELRNWEQAKRLMNDGVSSQVKKPFKAEELIKTIKFSLFQNQKI